jgi:DNA replication ATP-dependent helicase Dna2
MNGRQAIKRYQVVEIAQSTYVTPKGRTQPDQVRFSQPPHLRNTSSADELVGALC